MKNNKHQYREIKKTISGVNKNARLSNYIIIVTGVLLIVVLFFMHNVFIRTENTFRSLLSPSGKNMSDNFFNNADGADKKSFIVNAQRFQDKYAVSNLLLTENRKRIYMDTRRRPASTNTGASGGFSIKPIPR